MSTLATTLKALGHYVDQPAVIARVARQAKWVALGTGAAALGRDVYQSYRHQAEQPGGNPEQAKKAALASALVIGATGLGTALATSLLMKQKPATFVLGDEAKALLGKFPEHLRTLLQKERKSLAEMKTLVQNVPKGDLAKFLPVLEEASAGEMLKKYSLVGLTSIASGMAGGALANRLHQTGDAAADRLHNRRKLADMGKEGLFQFIANIFVCTLGTMGGIRLADQITPKLSSAILQKLTRLGLITGGLSLGIAGGGAIANAIGDKWIEPLANDSQAPGQGGETKPSQGGKRKIEFLDAILHIDDVPLALALSGVTILEPFIPLFFALSGYRTGMGYRNNHGKQPQASLPASTAAPRTAALPALTAGRPLARDGFQQFQQALPISLR